MRAMILLFVLLAFTPAFAAASKGVFQGRLYSFDQLMRLTPVKRAAYLKALTEVVLQMEKQQKKMEIADTTSLREMKEQIARLIKMSDFIPYAQAEEPIEPAEESAVVAAAADCAPPATLACKEIKEKVDLDRLKNEFRRNKKNECITAGNFVSYRNNVPKVGNCSYKYSFPDEKAANKLSCDRGESLCNPLLFCAGVDADINGSMHFLPAPICVNLGQDMTKTCLSKWEEATVSKKNKLDFSALKKKHRAVYNSARKATPRACDFSKDLEGFSGLKEKYDELKASVEGRYADLCVGDSAYQAMFCSECAIIGQQIYAMNTAGGYGGCGGGSEVKPSTPAADEDAAETAG
ncbi:MAG: hypothetical protein KF799_14495 [Bdellovibrionales bacterium]|nr:hypothetical protein [Bdellovibrionales bacterium]